MPVPGPDYASDVPSKRPEKRWAVGLVVVVAVLFAPAEGEPASGRLRESPGGVDARILAPTVREAVPARDPEASAPRNGVTDPRTRAEPLPLVSLFAGILFLLGLGWWAVGDIRSASGLLGLPARAPRAPPALGPA
jgi:hypothetical protein